jgi:hypothetical protein
MVIVCPERFLKIFFRGEIKIISKACTDAPSLSLKAMLNANKSRNRR